MSLTNRTLGGLMWTAWGRGSHVVLQVLALAVLARFLAPADFGVVSAALVVVGFSTIVTQIGLGPALVQRATLEPRHIETAFSTSVVLGLVLGMAVWAGAPLAARFFDMPDVQPVLRALAWLFPLHGIATVPESLMKRDLRFRWLANRDILSYGIGYVGVSVALAVAGFGVWSLVWGHIAQAVARTGILLWSSPPRVHSLGERAAFRELMYMGGGFTVAKAATYAAQQGDNLVIGGTLGPAALGFYGRAYQLMNAPSYGLGGLLDAVLFPTLAKIQHDSRRLATAFRRGTALIALAVLPVSAVLLILAPEVVQVVLGPRWAAVVPPFQILALGMLFRTSFKMSDSLSRSAGVVYRRAWRQVLYALAVLAGAWIGQHWGISGVAWGVLAAIVANFLLMAGLGLRVTGLTWWDLWSAHVPAIRLSVLVAPLVWAAATGLRLLDLPAIVTAAAAALPALALAALAVRLLPDVFLGPDGVWMITTLRDRLTSKSPRRRTVSPLLVPALEPGSGRIER